MKIRSYRFLQFINKFMVYFILTFFALVMIFPFLYMVTTSLKIPADTFRYPPRMLPRDPASVSVSGFEKPLPLYYVEVDGQKQAYALAKSNIKFGTLSLIHI